MKARLPGPPLDSRVLWTTQCGKLVSSTPSKSVLTSPDPEMKSVFGVCDKDLRKRFTYHLPPGAGKAAADSWLLYSRRWVVAGDSVATAFSDDRRDEWRAALGPRRSERARESLRLAAARTDAEAARPRFSKPCHGGTL